MSTTAATTGKGAKIAYAADVAAVGTSPTYLAEVTELKLPELTCGRIDATNYESPNNAMEYVSVKWTDAAEFQVEISYLQSQASTIYGLVGVDKAFKITIPGATTLTLTFLGHISKLGTEVPNKDRMKQTVSIAPHGAVTVA